MTVTTAAAWPVRLALLAAVAVTAVTAAWSVMPPGSEPAMAPRDRVSGERGLEDLEVVAARPHPVGSSAQQQVRDYPVAQARALGLAAEVQGDSVDGRQAERHGAGSRDRSQRP
jgi:hypothetical protein